MKKTVSLFLLVLLCACQSSQERLSTEILQIENGLLPKILVAGEALEPYNIIDRMARYKVPGVSIAVILDGKIRWAKGYGIANTEDSTRVNIRTLFQAGSISKPIAALAVLKLMDDGILDLDANVNRYLSDWKVGENRFTAQEKVTLRRLLRHQAGTTVHGFPGYSQDEAMPSLNAVLSGQGNTAAVVVDTMPGIIWRYSGGGYTILEKVMEDVTGLPLDEYMARHILGPMGMTNSTYAQPLPDSLHGQASAAYDSEGNIIDGLWHNYPEQAAAGLWTTPSDLTRYLISIHEIRMAKRRGVLTWGTVIKLITRDKNSWGLGPKIQKVDGEVVFSHGGKNAGFTNDMFAFVRQGAGAVVMTNGDGGGPLIKEILHSLSRYYDWKVNTPRTVSLVELDIDALQQLTGHYKLNFKVHGISDYFITVSIKEGQLFVHDPNNGDDNVLSPMKECEFIDIEKGNEVTFQQTEENGVTGLLWSGHYQFDRVIGE
ncbi:beta-lactamase family protein [bacterium]|nr:beta-lactamase family protein [bacterium]